MNKYFKTVILLVSCFLCANLSAQEYGAYNLLSEFDFEGESVVDNLGNLDATVTDVSIVWDAERESNVGYFDATSKSNIKLEDSPVNGEFTMGFWFKRADTDFTGNWRSAFAFYSADGSNIYFTPRTSWNDYSYLVVQNKAYSTYTTIAGNAITESKWVHLAITFSGTNCSLYMDGVLCGTVTIIGELPDFSSIYHYIGNYPANSYSMTSYIDDIKIYHTALEGNQITALYNGEEIPELVEEGLPYAKIDFNAGNTDDAYSNVNLTANNVAMTTYDKREVAELSAQSAMTTTTNPFGDEKYTLAMVYNTAGSSDDELIDKKLLEFTGDSGDYIEVYMREGLKLEILSSIDGTEKASGSSTVALTADAWNSIVFAQTYSDAGTGAMKIYINGTLGKTAVGVHSANASLSSWTIGSTDGTTVAGAIDEMVIYHEELLTADVVSYHNGTVESIGLSVDISKQYQTIKNFGASDGWSTQPLGLYFPEEKKEELAELLFSTEMDEDGNPKGIGLSSWRFNIGAGTSEQGDDSRISYVERRSECFLNADGETYDWTKQAGQVYFLRKAALEYDVDIIGWQNSPPVLYTKYNLGFREYGESTSATILLDEYYDDYAKFLADVVLHFEEEEGIEFKYISPLNEPQWSWGASASGGTVSQEGSPWSNQNIYDVVSAINTEFQSREVDSKIFIGEAGSLNYLLSGSTGHAAEQISTFWDESSNLNLRSMSSVTPIMSGHSYFTDTSADVIVNKRAILQSEMDATYPELEYWQTEYSLLNTGYQFGHNSDLIYPMQSAISLMRVMHNDLVTANATGWQWWTTFEQEAYMNSEDRFSLVRIAFNADNTDGVYRTTKLFYSFGNYSRFVRPGMVRIDLGRSDDMSSTDQITSQMFSAYMDPETNQVVIVAINASTGDCAITLPEVAIDDTHAVVNFTPYITSADDDLKKYDEVAAGGHYVMSGTTVTTFVGEVEEYSSTKEVMNKVEVSIAPNPTTNYVSIKSPATIEDIIVTDMSGRMVAMVQPNATQYTLSCESWNKGMYLVVVKSEGAIKTQKLIVK